MKEETKAAIERLRQWAKHEPRPAVHDGGKVISVDIDDDILAICIAAEQRDDLLAKIEYERGEADGKSWKCRYDASQDALSEVMTELTECRKEHAILLRRLTKSGRRNETNKP